MYLHYLQTIYTLSTLSAHYLQGGGDGGSVRQHSLHRAAGGGARVHAVAATQAAAGPGTAIPHPPPTYIMMIMIINYNDNDLLLHMLHNIRPLLGSSGWCGYRLCPGPGLLRPARHAAGAGARNLGQPRPPPRQPRRRNPAAGGRRLVLLPPQTHRSPALTRKYLL